MKCLSLFTIILCFLTSVCFGQQGAKSGTRSTKVAVPDKSDLRVYRNLRYAETDPMYTDTSSDRTLDLFVPVENSQNKLPVFIFIHGGGFGVGDKYGAESLWSKLLSSGFAVISINYRLHLKQNKVEAASASANMSKGLQKFHPDLNQAIRIASEDAQLALKWIKTNANRYQLNADLIAISGGSAGAMAALYTAYVSGQKILPIKAVVDLWGGLENAELIKKGAPPVLIYHGDHDNLIHVDYAYALKRQMEKIGNSRSVLRVIEGRGHAIYKLIAEEKAEEIVAFLNETLK